MKLASKKVEFRMIREHVEGVALYLPRLSSPAKFDTFCSDDRSR